MLFCPFHARLTGTAVAPVSLVVCFPTFRVRLTRTAIAPVPLMVCLLFRAWLARTTDAPVSLMVCLPLSCAGSPGQPLLRFCSLYVCPFSCAAHRDGHCFSFSSWCVPPSRAQLAGTGVALVSLMMCSPFCAWLTGMAITLVLLMELAPFMQGSLGQPLLWFRSWCVFPLLFAGSPGRPLLRFYSWCVCPYLCLARQDGHCIVLLMMCSPSCTARRDVRCSHFTHGVSPFSCTASQNGHCSGFAHSIQGRRHHFSIGGANYKFDFINCNSY